jgi:hypothetical protein
VLVPNTVEFPTLLIGEDMSGPFRSARRRLARAESHISNLECAVGAYLQSEAYAIVTEPHYLGIERFFQVKLKLVKPIPDELSDVAVEAIDALRSALDQTCFAVATKPDSKSAYFPFGDTAAGLENVIQGRCKDLPPEIVDLLRSFKPYRDGDEILWGFNKVRQLNQHAILAAVGVATEAMALSNINLFDGELGIANPHWDREKNEMLIATVSHAAKYNFNANVAIKIVFNDAGPLTELEAVPLLRTSAYKVANIIDEVEKKAVGLRPNS